MRALVGLTLLVILAHEASCTVFQLGFERTTYSALEGGPFEVCLTVISNDGSPLASDGNVTLRRTYEFGNAEFLDGVIIPSGSDVGSVICTNFTAVNNDQLDNGNTITVKIISASPGIEISSDCTAFVQITDDDIVEIGFSQANHTVDEDAGTVTICLEVQDALDATQRPIDVIVYTVPHLDARVAFETLRRIVQIPTDSVQDSTVCFDVEIIDDGDFNPDTYFLVCAEEEDLNVHFGFSANFGCALVTVLEDDPEPCVLYFIDDTPTVNGDNISVSLAGCGGAAGAMCELVGEQVSGLCSEGLVTPVRGRRTLRVTLDELNGIPLERELRTDNSPRCDVHFINHGVTIDAANSTATFEFEGTGPNAEADHVNFFCNDGVSGNGPCTSPYTTDVLESGTYRFRVGVAPFDGCERRIRRDLIYVIP